MDSTDQLQKRGRPSAFTAEIAEEIIDRLSTGEPLEQICRSENMPSSQTVRNWKKENAEFSLAIARARDDGFDQIALDALRIADDSSGDVIETERGPKMDAEFVARSRLRVETRLKLLAKWNPQKYGEKLDVSGIPANQTNVILPWREKLKRIRKPDTDLIGDGKTEEEKTDNESAES